MSIPQQVRQFIEGHLLTFNSEKVLDADDNFFELGFVDSSFAMQLVNFVEETFAIRVDDEDLDLANFSTINRIAQFVARKREMRGVQ